MSQRSSKPIEIKGKGIYAWVLYRCENGIMQNVIQRLKSAGMTHIITKIADWDKEYLYNRVYLESLVYHAHQEGIQVLGYHYVYGNIASREADAIIRELKKYPYDGLVINAEIEYRDLPNNSEAAKIYCEKVRSAFPDLTLALSTYRYPSYHRNFPFETFLNYCDYNMPQVYWMGANGTVPRQLEQCVKEYRDYPSTPMIPTGAAFTEHGWTAIPTDQKIFIEQVQKHGLAGCNWWEYWHAVHRLPALWTPIAETDFDSSPSVPPVVPPVIPPVTPPPSGEPLFHAVCTATNGLYKRAGAGTQYPVVGYFKNNEETPVYKVTGIWWKVEALKEVWASSNFLKKVGDSPITPPVEPSPTPKQSVYVSGTLYIRKGPGIEHGTVGSVTAGRTYPVYEISNNGWYRINDSTPQHWISGNTSYTTLIVESTPTDPTEPPVIIPPSDKPLEKLYYPCEERWYITQRFGANPGNYTTSRGHNGVDFGTPVGRPIFAAEAGLVVVAVAQTNGYGRHVRIQHSHGVTIYGHLSRMDVKVGDRVSAKQVIGLSGGAKSDPYSGYSTGPHLHFEYRIDYPPVPMVPGSYVYYAIDPLPLLVYHEYGNELFKIKVITDALNMRSGPTSLHSVLGGAYRGQILNVYEVSPLTGWYRVGLGMWVSNRSDLVEKVL